MRKDMLPWNDDRRVKQKTSLQVLVAWLTTADNYARWTKDHSTREEISGEIQALLREQGICHRSNSSIKSRIWMLEQAVAHAQSILRRKGYGNLTNLDLDPCDMDVKIFILHSCPQFQELAPIMKAAATSPETVVKASDTMSTFGEAGTARATIVAPASGVGSSYPNTRSASLAKPPMAGNQQEEEPRRENATSDISPVPQPTETTGVIDSSTREVEETELAFATMAAEPAEDIVTEANSVHEESSTDAKSANEQEATSKPTETAKEAVSEGFASTAQTASTIAEVNGEIALNATQSSESIQIEVNREVEDHATANDAAKVLNEETNEQPDMTDDAQTEDQVEPTKKAGAADSTGQAEGATLGAITSPLKEVSGLVLVSQVATTSIPNSTACSPVIPVAHESGENSFATKTQVSPVSVNRQKTPNSAVCYQRVHWEHLHGHGNRSSIQILLDWITTNDTYARWKYCRTSKKELTADAKSYLLAHGIEDRTEADIHKKIGSLEKSMTLAKRLLTENGLRGLVSLDLCTNLEVRTQILRCCPYFHELAPVMTPDEDQQRFLSLARAPLDSNPRRSLSVLDTTDAPAMAIEGNNITDFVAAETAADASMGDEEDDDEGFEFIGVKQESGVRQVLTFEARAQDVVHEVPSHDQMLADQLQFEAQQDRYDFERQKRRIELVVETTLARQKLLHAGVSREDVDRLLPETA